MIKINVFNETDKKLNKERYYIKKILKKAVKHQKLNNLSFNVIIVDNNYIKNLNSSYRKIDRETDVITFALEDYKKFIFKKMRILGDIYISIDKTVEQAKEYNHSNIREICFLSVHGFLHLLGYDHMNKEDKEVMFKLQKEILDDTKYAKR